MIYLWNEVLSIINRYGRSKDTLLSLIDEQGNFYFLNSEMRKVLDVIHLPENKINLFDLMQPEHIERFKKIIRLSEETQKFYPAQINIKNGHYHSIELQVHPLPFSSSKRKLFLCMGYEVAVQPTLTDKEEIVHFITPLKKTKDIASSLQETVSLYYPAMKKAPALTWMINEEENLVFSNTSFNQYFNLPADAINKNIRTYIPKKIVDCFYEKHVDKLAAGNPVISIEKVRLANGSDILFHVSLFATESGSGAGTITGQAFILPGKTDIEKQLDKANEQLLLLSRATTDAIWEWDMRTGYIFRNDALTEMIGYQVNDTNGLAWWFRRIHPDDRNRVSDKIREATDKGLLSWNDEYRFKCADGDYKDIHDRGYIVYENGLPVKMICSLHDVSLLKSLQNQLHKEKLERQQELSETVIHVQEKERTRIGYELHDNINQILSTAKLFIDMLKPAEAEQKKIKEKTVEYLLTAIEEIRKLSKDLVVPQLKEKGLADSIRTMIDDILFAGVIKIKFTHDHETDLLSTGKKVTLFRIVQEQMKNILKYSHAKNAEIYLYCKGRTVTLIIKDDGIGFDPAQTRRGIGLSNIFERTRFYNGTVSIETSHGHGCIMTINMPFE